jgi:hypothetical protein
LIEGEIDSDVCSTPVLSGARMSVKRVFADQRKFRVERDTNSRISGKLKSRTIIK